MALNIDKISDFVDIIWMSSNEVSSAACHRDRENAFQLTKRMNISSNNENQTSQLCMFNNELHFLFLPL